MIKMIKMIKMTFWRHTRNTLQHTHFYHTFLSEHTHANIIHNTRYTIHDTKYEIHDTRIHAVHLKGASERARDTYFRTTTE